MSGKMKIFKLENDVCFGKKHSSTEECPDCVIERSCEISQRNKVKKH